MSRSTSTPARYHATSLRVANVWRLSRARDRRHSFGTHAALFGVGPRRLQAWMGHKRIDETMLYVHVAEAHHREMPEVIRQAAMGESDPDTRIVRMLGARRSHVAAEIDDKNGKTVIPAA